MVTIEKPHLREYRWSGFPLLCRGGKLPKWLHGDDVLRWYHWDIESRKDRRAYEEYLQTRAEACWTSNGDEQNEEEWRKIRRGWFLGGEEIRDRLEEMAALVVKGRKRSSYKGEALRQHDQSEAQQLLWRGLRRLRLTLPEARKLRENDPRKQGLIWLVKSQTVVRDQ